MEVSTKPNVHLPWGLDILLIEEKGKHHKSLCSNIYSSRIHANQKRVVCSSTGKWQTYYIYTVVLLVCRKCTPRRPLCPRFQTLHLLWVFLYRHTYDKGYFIN
jgi:hypothetical protein